MKQKSKACKGGYPCGASCISVTYVCRKQFSEGVSVSIEGLRRVYIDGKPQVKSLEPEPELESPEKNISFEELVRTSKKQLGEGQFAVAFETAGGNVVKEGTFSDNEIEIMTEAGQLGVSPKVIKSEKGRRVSYVEDFDNFTGFRGKVLMEKVKGYRAEDEFIEDEAESFLNNMKTLHKNKISHNDLHDGNIITNGKQVSILDYGFAKKGGVYAFAEALNLRNSEFIDNLPDDKLKRFKANTRKANDLFANDTSFTKADKSRFFYYDAFDDGEYRDSGIINDPRWDKYVDIIYDGL